MNVHIIPPGPLLSFWETVACDALYFILGVVVAGLIWGFLR
jgi:hypothetical protein